MALARMRTITQCVNYFKEQDPDSSVSYYCISNLVKSNKINCVKSGNKTLINLDTLIEYFEQGEKSSDAKKEKVVEYGKLRKVEV